MKYYQSYDGTKLKIEGDKGYLKPLNGKEKEVPHTSKTATDILIENNPISEKEYVK